jgi:osmotically inducible lipoprotein OsmB
MVRTVSIKYILAMVLAICFVVLSAAPESSAHRRSYRHHHSKTKGAVVGGAIGAVGGALVGGGKGAVLGGAAGAGTGALIQHHRNRHSRRHRRIQ